MTIYTHMYTLQCEPLQLLEEVSHKPGYGSNFDISFDFQPPALYLDFARVKGSPDHDDDRVPYGICILQFPPQALILAVIEKDVHRHRGIWTRTGARARHGELVVDLFRRLDTAPVRLLHDDHGFKWRDDTRPIEPRLVRQTRRHGRDEPRHADPVAAHFDRDGILGVVESAGQA